MGCIFIRKKTTKTIVTGHYHQRATLRFRDFIFPLLSTVASVTWSILWSIPTYRARIPCWRCVAAFQTKFVFSDVKYFSWMVFWNGSRLEEKKKCQMWAQLSDTMPQLFPGKILSVSRTRSMWSHFLFFFFYVGDGVQSALCHMLGFYFMTSSHHNKSNVLSYKVACCCLQSLLEKWTTLGSPAICASQKLHCKI